MYVRVPGLAVCALGLQAVMTAACGPAPAAAAQHAGPIIEHFGKVYDVPGIGLPTPLDEQVKLRFDVKQAAKPGHLNAGFETLARFLNMHAAAGVPREHMHLALVVHGPAVVDTLSSQAAHLAHGRDNPNAELLEALAAAGVRIFVCGQSASESRITRADITPGATLALSAMTAHLVLTREGYELNPF